MGDRLPEYWPFLRKNAKDFCKSELFQVILRNRDYKMIVVHRISQQRVPALRQLVCLGHHCVDEGSHSENSLLKVYRHFYRDVVDLKEMEKHIDCSYIQAYKCNKRSVITLTPLPHCGPQTSGEASCDTCMRKLYDPSANRYCSIICKVQAFLIEKNGPDTLVLAIEGVPQERRTKRHQSPHHLFNTIYLVVNPQNPTLIYSLLPNQKQQSLSLKLLTENDISKQGQSLLENCFIVTKRCDSVWQSTISQLLIYYGYLHFRLEIPQKRRHDKQQSWEPQPLWLVRTCNKELVLALTSIPHCGSEKCAQLAHVTCMRKLMDPIVNHYSSLARKLEAFSKEVDESDVPILEIQCPSPSRERNAKRSRKGIPQRAAFF